MSKKTTFYIVYKNRLLAYIKYHISLIKAFAMRSLKSDIAFLFANVNEKFD